MRATTCSATERSGRDRAPGGTARSEWDSRTPVIRYVNCVLYQMFRSKTLERVLRQSEALPTISEFGDPVHSPSLDAVINRLKIMTGLNPVNYPDLVEGSVQVHMDGAEGQVHCHFDDSSDERCRIAVEKPGSGQDSDLPESSESTDGLA